MRRDNFVNGIGQRRVEHVNSHRTSEISVCAREKLATIP
jgi:hypothetical protein